MLINVTTDAINTIGKGYLTWTPRKVTITLVDAEGDPNPTVKISSTGVVDLQISETMMQSGDAQLTHAFMFGNNTFEFWASGIFGSPSSVYGDAGIQIEDVTTGNVVWSQAMMVRIRKNANQLSTSERDTFLEALGTLNDNGNGKFSDFRDTHTNQATQEAHFDAGFLPWHRAYMLDLERELQAIDSDVSLPYWRFDESAANVFHLDFMGLPNRFGDIQFTPGHPLQSWMTNGQLGISRRMVQIQPNLPPPGVLSESATLGLGTDYFNFITNLETNPHGIAHTRFSGYISSIPTAARDPLFFMLHCNVDRLWAKWQMLHGRHDKTDPDAYTQPYGRQQIGHYLADTMWPWNNVSLHPRPSSAPRTPLAMPDLPTSLSLTPEIGDMIDYSGVVSGTGHGFHYDDVPFDFTFGQGEGGNA